MTPPPRPNEPVPPERRLAAFLREWLGAWPPPRGELVVVGASQRAEPSWDGAIRPVAGVETVAGTILSVPPEHAAAVEAAAERAGGDLDRLGTDLGRLLDRPDWRFSRGIFRSTISPTPGEDLGRWVAAHEPGVPAWLAPFNGDVLVVEIDGQVAAGVGRKIHNDHGHELAVVTEEAFRGRGLAAALVAQAARRVLDDGAIPIYLHAEDNAASARTAEASGFGHDGALILGLFPGRPG